MASTAFQYAQPLRVHHCHAANALISSRPHHHRYAVTHRPCTPRVNITHRCQDDDDQSFLNLTPSCVAATPKEDKAFRDQLVNTLLFFVKDTDRGGKTTTSERQAIDASIDQLCNQPSSSSSSSSSSTSTTTAVTSNESVDQTIPNYTSGPLLFDNYEVAYSATSSDQKSPPVGGLLRTTLGKLLFQTRGIYEHFISPDIVVQLLCFRFLGLLNGCVALRGQLIISKEIPNELIFQFGKPRLRLGPAVFEYGPCPRLASTVKYLDDRIRIMQGRRGSRFVFIRRPYRSSSEEEADKKHSNIADEWKYTYNTKPLPTILLPLTLIMGITISFFAPLILRVVVITFLVVVAFLLKRGGAVERNPTNMPPPSPPVKAT